MTVFDPPLAGSKSSGSRGAEVLMEQNGVLNSELMSAEFSVQEMEKVSQQIKAIWASNPQKITSSDNINKILYFAHAIHHKTKTVSNENSLLSLVDIAWKRFIYPVMSIFKHQIKNSVNQKEKETSIDDYFQFLRSTKEIFSSSIQRLKHPSTQQTNLTEILCKLYAIKGDVCRYIAEINPKEISPTEIEMTYFEALKLNSNDCVIYNQIGSLLQNSDMLKSLLCLYMSGLCEPSLPYSEINATTLLDSTREMFFLHIKKKEIIEVKSKLFSIGFLNLVDLYLNRSDDVAEIRIKRLNLNFSSYTSKFLAQNSRNISEILDYSHKTILLIFLLIERSIIFKSIVSNFLKLLNTFTTQILKFLIRMLKQKFEDDLKNEMDGDQSSSENEIDGESHSHKSENEWIMPTTEQLSDFSILILLSIYKFDIPQKSEKYFASSVFLIASLIELDLENEENKPEFTPESLPSTFNLAHSYLTSKNAGIETLNCFLNALTKRGLISPLTSNVQNGHTEGKAYRKKSSKANHKTPTSRDETNSQNSFDENRFDDNGSVDESSDDNDDEFRDPSETFNNEESEDSLQNAAINIPNGVADVSAVHDFEIIVPLSEALQFNINKLVNYVEMHGCRVHILMSVLAQLDKQKNERKTARDVISAINDHFTQGSESIVPQDSLAETLMCKIKHRNQKILEMMSIHAYCKFLTSEAKYDHIKPQKILILTQEPLTNDDLLFEYHSKLSELGVQILTVHEIFRTDENSSNLKSAA